MMRSSSLVALFILSVLLPSCFKEDEPVTPHPRGDIRTDTIPMTENYLYQVFFSLDSGKIVRSNVKTTYDLGFECSGSGWHVILNSSNFMKVADLGKVPFGQPYDTAGMALRFDKSDGNPDSTAIGEWFTAAGGDTVSNGHIYAVSRGLDELGNPLGVYQVVFDSLKHGTFYFRYAPLKGGTGTSGNVRKNSSYSYLYFSFITGSEVPVEPGKNEFDLLFSQYTTLLFTDEGIPYPYLVTGVLLNRHNVVVAIDSTTDFHSISRESAGSLPYSKALDVIGYDWNYYNYNDGIYTIRPGINYVVRSVSGLLYKLRFVGYYSKDGLKGYPVIEFQEL